MIQEIKSEYQKLLELVKEKEEIEKQWNEAIKKFYESKIKENEKEQIKLQCFMCILEIS